MEREPREPDSASFIVRLHREDDSHEVWRGEIEHVRTGDRLAIGDGRRLLAFIRGYTAASVFPDLPEAVLPISAVRRPGRTRRAASG
jgi:hypothetical protein